MYQYVFYRTDPLSVSPHVGTIEKQYCRDFGVRSDMHLGTLLERTGLSSLNDLLRGGKGKWSNQGAAVRVYVPPLSFVVRIRRRRGARFG